MNIKGKTSLIIIITLVLGFLLGIAVTDIFTPSARPGKRRSGRDYFRRLERIIKPEESNRKEIEEILTKYKSRMHEVKSDYNAKMYNLRDSMQAEFDKVLTPGQKQRLEKHYKRGRGDRGRKSKSGRRRR
jgi:Spy/CpxP family protein refolding chaperone